MATAAIHDVLFTATDALQVRDALRTLGAELVVKLSRDVEQALQGDDEATRRYVRDWRELTERLIAEASDAHPLVVHGASADDVDLRPGQAVASVLENLAADAPFSAWTTRFDLGDAAALQLITRLREQLGAPALQPPTGPPRLPLVEFDVRRFLHRVRRQLDHADGEHPLRRLIRLFELSKAELGRLFGVRRQAVDGWLEHGVPAERQEKLAAMLAVADLLERKFKAGRLPGVARRPAAAYGGESMLGMMAADRHGELLEKLRGAFDWSEAA